MGELVTWLLVSFAIVVGLFGLLIVLRYLIYVAYQAPVVIGEAVGGLADSFRDTISEARQDATTTRGIFHRNRKRRKLKAELAARVAARKFGGRPDMNFVRDSQLMELAEESFRMFSEVARYCDARAHLQAQTFPDVEHMEGFRWEPDLVEVRQEVVDVADLALESISSSRHKPRDLRVDKMRLGLSVMRRRCGHNCPLLRLETSNLPLHCTVVEWLNQGIRAEYEENNCGDE